jgi:hypothetical protein
MFKMGESEPVLSITKTVQVPPDINGQYTFSYSFEESGDYIYHVSSGDRLLVDGPLVLSVE